MKTLRFALILSLCVASCANVSYANVSYAKVGNVKAPLSSGIRAKKKSNGSYTPKKGSAERKAILNGFRAVWLNGSGYKNVIFVVDYLAVKNGWAYLSVSPQSPDGKNHYEGESALMRLQAGKWKVLQRLGGEIECDLLCLKRKFPQMPTAIYPAN